MEKEGVFLFGGKQVAQVADLPEMSRDYSKTTVLAHGRRDLFTQMAGFSLCGLR